MEKIAKMFGYGDVEGFVQEFRGIDIMGVADAMLNAGMTVPDDATLKKLATDICRTIDMWENQ